MSFSKVVLKNWKKSGPILAISTTALWFTYDYSVTNDVMKTSCRRATLLGDALLKNPNSQPRHITVILNPVAGKRKSKKLYTKWVEPIFHLAGVKVSLIETQSPNQAHDLMKIMSDCDGVAIVGGDGTVHEALNGLLHRDDNSTAINKFPIGIMPTGQYNSIARYIHQNLTYRNQKEFLINSALRLVDSCTLKYDVLKIEPLVRDPHDSREPIYALRDVRYGKYQDNFFKTSGYHFYQANIKPFWLRIKNIFSQKNPNPRIESLSYTEPCKGCSRCIDKHKLIRKVPPKIEEEHNVNRRWWSMLAPVKKVNQGPTAEELEELESAKRDNPSCEKWIKVQNLEDISDFRACMMGDRKVRLSMGLGGEYNPSDIVDTKDIKLEVSKELDEEKKASSEKKAETSNSKKEGEEEKIGEKKEEKDLSTKFLIDGQPVQAHSIKINALTNVVTIFTGSMKLDAPVIK